MPPKSQRKNQSKRSSSATAVNDESSDEKGEYKCSK